MKTSQPKTPRRSCAVNAELRIIQRRIRGSFGQPRLPVTRDYKEESHGQMPQASGKMFLGMPAGRNVGPIEIAEFNRRAADMWRSAPTRETVEKLKREWARSLAPDRNY